MPGRMQQKCPCSHCEGKAEKNLGRIQEGACRVPTVSRMGPRVEAPGKAELWHRQEPGEGQNVLGGSLKTKTGCQGLLRKAPTPPLWLGGHALV